MMNRTLNPSGRAASAADVTLEVCLSDVSPALALYNEAASRPSTLSTHRCRADKRLTPPIPGRNTISVPSPSHSSPVSMHHTAASRG